MLTALTRGVTPYPFSRINYAFRCLQYVLSCYNVKGKGWDEVLRVLASYETMSADAWNELSLKISPYVLRLYDNYFSFVADFNFVACKAVPTLCEFLSIKRAYAQSNDVIERAYRYFRDAAVAELLNAGNGVTWDTLRPLGELINLAARDVDTASRSVV